MTAGTLGDAGAWTQLTQLYLMPVLGVNVGLVQLCALGKTQLRNFEQVPDCLLVLALNSLMVILEIMYLLSTLFLSEFIPVPPEYQGLSHLAQIMVIIDKGVH